MFSFSTLLVGMALVLVQALAAVPWVFTAFARREVVVHGLWRFLTDLFSTRSGRLLLLYVAGGVLVAALVLPPLFFTMTRDKDAIENWGRLYGAVLQLQLTIDFFVLIFPLLLVAWPKGSAVAQAAFREGVRQPMFWLLLVLAVAILFISTFLPYFTFGEDILMVKELGYDTIMAFAVIFGVLAASMFVSEEIEGRTAVTLMSKPVSRRQFLLGKYVGILLVALLMFGLLGEHFEGTLLLKRYLDRLDPLATPEWLTPLVTNNGLPDLTNDLLHGIGMWISHTLDTLPGLVLSFSHVMVLVSISVAIATRVPMLVNLVVIAVIYLFGNMAPHLVMLGHKAQQSNPGSVVAQMLLFIAQVFDTLLPGLDFFKAEPSLISDIPPAAGPYALYLLSVTIYGLLYTLLVILFGLVLFEDRDVA
jgi:ABC-2 family transporter protein